MPNTKTVHFFSQLVYLDTVPAMAGYNNKTVTVGALAGYYLNNPVGRMYLKNRFGAIEREYSLWLEMLGDLGELADWKIGYILDDNSSGQTGFYGCAYVSASGYCVVAFRGSEMLGDKNYRGDYITDLALGYMVPTPQQAKVDSFWAGFPLEKVKDITVTGHSLGGNLAAYSVVTAPIHIAERLRGCISFNAPGFCREFVNKYSERIAAVRDIITLYQNKYDPVSSMLENIVTPVITASICDPGDNKGAFAADIFYPHSNFCFQTDEEGNFIPDPENKKSDFCRNIHILTDMFQLLPVKVREELAEVILKAMYAAPSPKKRMQFILDATLKYISRNEIFSSPGHIDSASVAYAAVMPGEDREDFDIYKLISEGKTTGISALARTARLLAGMM